MRHGGLAVQVLAVSSPPFALIWCYPYAWHAQSPCSVLFWSTAPGLLNMTSGTNNPYDSSDDSICPVCYRGLDDNQYAVRPCGHVFCDRCLAEHLWREQATATARCPYCRQQLVEAVPSKPASRVLRLKLGKATFHVRDEQPLPLTAESQPLLRWRCQRQRLARWR